MADSYTVLWTGDYCRYLASAGEVGKPLRFVWGGHNQATRFSFYKVEPGDFVYPLRVLHEQLYVVARMKVGRLLSREGYLKLHPEDKHLIRHNCANEVLVGEGGTPLRLDVAVPPEMLGRLRFRSGNKERGLRHAEGGRLRSVVSLQGVYRLSEESAEYLRSLVDEGGPQTFIRESE